MRLLHKMILFGGVFFAVMCGIGGLAYMTVTGMRDVVRDIGQDNLPIHTQIVRISSNHLSQAAWFQKGVVSIQSKDAEGTAYAVRQFKLYSDSTTDELAAVEVLLHAADDSDAVKATRNLRMRIAQRVSNIQSSYLEWSAAGDVALSALQSGERSIGDTRIKELQERSEELGKILSETISDVEQLTLNEVQAGVETIDSLIVQMILVCVACVSMMLLIGWLITSQVLGQLGSDPATLAEIAEKVAAGQLDMPLESDKVGVLDSIISIVENLREVISRIKMSANEVSQASTQVGIGNTDLSQRIQEQASSLEEVAASMEEMTGTVNQNAENALQANKIALEARDQAVEGGEVSGRTVVAMNEISASSKKIADIIGVIDDIAFQTNLLALNAAVEAARAGEQGRGFAVVATEVRSLAGRSATAAKEIKELILDSVRKVEDGTKLVDESGKKLEEIVGSVIKVSDNVAEIASASQEQSEGISQVNKAVVQMDDMTQENASLVEEAAAAGETVDAQAHELRELISFFHVGNEDSTTSEVESQRKFKFTPAALEQSSQRSKNAGRSHAGLLSSDPDSKLNDDSNWEEF